MNARIEGHTVQRFDGELNHLYLRVLEMAGLVLNQTEGAVRTVSNKDLEAARTLIERDNSVNRLEMQADEEIVDVIARRSPVARDLRTAMALSRIVNDLETVGDEASRIAGRTLSMYDSDSSVPSGNLLRDVNRMGRLVVEMLRQSLSALDEMDVGEAEVLAYGASDLDGEFQSCLRKLATFVLEDHRNVGHAINLTLIAKSLERIGEHAKSISQHVVYMVKGTDVRHLQEKVPPVPSNPPPQDAE